MGTLLFFIVIALHGLLEQVSADTTPTPAPSSLPTSAPSSLPTSAPTAPSALPTPLPTAPSALPTLAPTLDPPEYILLRHRRKNDCGGGVFQMNGFKFGICHPFVNSENTFKYALMGQGPYYSNGNTDDVYYNLYYYSNADCTVPISAGASVKVDRIDFMKCANIDPTTAADGNPDKFPSAIASLPDVPGRSFGTNSMKVMFTAIGKSYPGRYAMYYTTSDCSNAPYKFTAMLKGECAPTTYYAKTAPNTVYHGFWKILTTNSAEQSYTYVECDPKKDNEKKDQEDKNFVMKVKDKSLRTRGTDGREVFLGDKNNKKKEDGNHVYKNGKIYRKEDGDNGETVYLREKDDKVTIKFIDIEDDRSDLHAYEHKYNECFMETIDPPLIPQSNAVHWVKYFIY